MRFQQIFIAFIIFTISKSIAAQNFSDSWTGHFSYLDIKDISQGTNKIFGAAENAIFIYDTQTNEIEKISTINGLSGETISSIHYVEENGILLIGFENGLMQVYKESNSEFLTVVDIFDKPTIPPNDKRINHFNIYNGYAYISTDYGISLYDINALEFGDTYLIGPVGSQIKVNQTTVFQDYIYVATESRLYRAIADNPNLINYEEWEGLTLGNWSGIQTGGDKLYSCRDKRVYEVINNSPVQLVSYQNNINDFIVVGDNLVVTAKNETYVYFTESFTQIAYATNTDEFVTDFTNASVDVNNNLFIGTIGIQSTGKRGYGILKTTFSDTSVFEEVHPESPLANKFFQVRTQGGQIYGVHGGYSVTYNFNGGTARSGISYFKDEKWQNIVYDSIVSSVANPYYLSHISINPFNSNQAYISSYYSGLIDITNGEVATFYTQDNSSLVPLFGAVYLIVASNYDSEGALWVTNGRVNQGLNRFKDGQWTSYSFESIITPATSNLGYSEIAFDNEGNIFIGSYRYGIISFKESNGAPELYYAKSEEDNMPAENVTCVSVDQQNQVWVGTSKGLRIIYNPSNFANGNKDVENIVVLEDGTPQELLFQQYLTDIEVDGSNNKWISTLDTGVYYFSSDGQETIYHFTKDNSPLPTNEVLDIDLDEVNGIVYFATGKGLVSFRSDTSKPQETLQDAYVYPNPVRPTFNISQEKVKIKGLTENVNIKITDIEGNLVTEAESRTNSKFKGYNLEVDGGTALWNGKNMADRTVASGVYLIMLSDLDSLETKVLKVMVVR